MEWKPEKHLKRYPHFDAPITSSQARALVTDPKRVAEHPFHPFLLYNVAYYPFSRDGNRGAAPKKVRPIRYAAHSDAVIFAYYRHQLSRLYESELIRRDIAGSVLAYRRIAIRPGGRGKCNIDFAAEAFAKIQSFGSCCAVALDISKFFEHIHHTQLLRVWTRLLGVEKLPRDHRAVFRAITRYRDVDRTTAYERLGFFGERTDKHHRTRRGFLKSKFEMPIRLCSNEDFRVKIAGQTGKVGDVITANPDRYGIPQGAPMSDLLANLYLIDFDTVVHRQIAALGGSYWRYSDDILLVAPGGQSDAELLSGFIAEQLAKSARNLKVNDSKTACVIFERDTDGRLLARRLGSDRDFSGLDYLGFRFDGRGVFIRDSTLTRLNRKVVRAARRRARTVAGQFTGQNLAFLLQKFDVSQFKTRFMDVRDFERYAGNPRAWTFKTYVLRSQRIFSNHGLRVGRQLRRFHRFIDLTVERELESAVAARGGARHP